MSPLPPMTTIFMAALSLRPLGPKPNDPAQQPGPHRRAMGHGKRTCGPGLLQRMVRRAFGRRDALPPSPQNTTSYRRQNNGHLNPSAREMSGVSSSATPDL